MESHSSPCSPACVCRSRTKRYGEPVCQSLSIAHLDRAVSDAFLAVIQPAALEAVLVLSEELAREQAQVARQWQLRLEPATKPSGRGGSTTSASLRIGWSRASWRGAGTRVCTR
jgi:hypothetical protein